MPRRGHDIVVGGWGRVGGAGFSRRTRPGGLFGAPPSLRVAPFHSEVKTKLKKFG